MLRDFNQKTRNKPVAITDIAISKVPKTNLYGFTSKENTFIQEQHKLLLKIAKNYNSSNEVGILMDIVTWETWIIVGKSNCVEIRSNPEAYKRIKCNQKNSLLFMHNHPSTSTFSGEDLKTFCMNSSLYIMTVVGNDGNIRFLRKTNKFDANLVIITYFKLALEKYKDKANNGTLAMQELLKNCCKYGLEYKIGGTRK